MGMSFYWEIPDGQRPGIPLYWSKDTNATLSIYNGGKEEVLVDGGDSSDQRLIPPHVTAVFQGTKITIFSNPPDYKGTHGFYEILDISGLGPHL